MAQLEWLAAALSPSDIAPHPNFFSTEQVTEVSIFALVCSARWSELERAIASSSDLDLTTIFTARDALTAGESHQAADRIAESVRNWPDEGDPAKQTALTLVASLAYCELDIYPAAFDLINSVIEQLEINRSADKDLLLAALYQQLAMRQRDYGVDDASVQSARQAKSYIDNLDTHSLSNFPLSQGAGWSSATTLSDIALAIADAAQWLLINLGGPFAEGWQDLVRSRPGYLDLKALRNTVQAYEQFVNDLLEVRLPSGAVTFGSSNAETYLYSALLSEEFLGAPSARSVRNELGKVRFLEGVETGEVWLMTESMNLLRQGRDHRRLRNVVSHIRNAGPLSALADCAVQVMTNRDPVSFSLGELIVLRAAADQLDPKVAQSYYPRITQMFRDPETFTLQELAFREEAFLTGAEFAKITESPTGFAGTMFQLLQRLRGQELYETAVARGLYAYDIAKASAEERTAWTTWLNRLDANELPAFAGTIGLIFDSEIIPGSRDGDVVTLESVANYVDRWLRYRRPIPDAIMEEAVPVLINSLRAIKEEAHQGIFGYPAIDTATAAAVVAQHSRRSDLWSELASFLSDAAVQRSNTQNAFEYLSDDPSSVPAVVRNELAASKNAVLYATTDILRSPRISPYPAAVRFYASARLMNDSEVITEISALAGSELETARAAGCAALATYATHVDTESIWVSVLALQLSKDRAATVRALAGWALAALLGAQSELQSLILTRVESLLGEDGLAVPLNLLRGLSKSEQALDPQLISRIQQLAVGSVSAQIRKAAAKLLEQQPDAS